MKKILILYPHFPPSNLAGVHRPRLFAQHLPQFGWEPTVLTVDEKYYEETLDYDLVKLLPADLRIERVKAFKVGKIRLVGDIGLRSFFQLYKRARRLISSEKFDFLYIPVPSFYCALLGRLLHQSTKIKYGIDYIDPWVHHFPGSERKFSRHWWSMKLSYLLEPIAVKRASLITGVAEGYYKGVRERNQHLINQCIFEAMPYGGEIEDHRMVNRIGLEPYLFQRKESVLQLVYAGAFLPKAVEPLKKVLAAISQNPSVFSDVEIHFIGTGRVLNDTKGYTIKPLAEEAGLWQSVVFEYPARIPYLDVLTHLAASSGVFILGSTEPHYTPSKVYQAILSNKPILSILHRQSSACEAIKMSNMGISLTFDGEHGLTEIEESFVNVFTRFRQLVSDFEMIRKDLEAFHQYSAHAVTEKLSRVLNQIV
jgi:hypothetical protein